MDTKSLVRKVEDELGIDVYYVYEDGRHLIPEPMVVAFVTAVITAYLIQLLGVRDLAERHRQAVLALVGKIRGEGLSAAELQSTAQAGQDEMRLRVEQAAQQSAPSPEGMQVAQESVARLLAEIGMPPEAANDHSEKISQLIRDYLRQAHAGHTGS